MAILATGMMLGLSSPSSADSIRHLPLPAGTFSVVKGQDRLIAATTSARGPLKIVTENFDGSDRRTVAQIPRAAGRSGRTSAVTIAASATSWIVGWRTIKVVNDDQASDTYDFIQSEQIVAGTTGGGQTVLEQCAGRSLEALGEDQNTSWAVTADGDRVAYGGAVCPGRAGIWAGAPAAVTRLTTTGTGPILAGAYLAYARDAPRLLADGPIVLADSSTGASLRDTAIKHASVESFDVGSDGTLAVIRSASPGSQLVVATPAAAPRVVGPAEPFTDVLLSGSTVAYATLGGQPQALDLAGIDPTRALAADLPETERFRSGDAGLLSLDARRVVYVDRTCGGSELTVEPLAGTAIAQRLPAQCLVEFPVSSVKATRTGGVRITLRCPQGCHPAYVKLMSGTHVIADGFVRARAGMTGAAILKLTPGYRRRLAHGSLHLNVIATNSGRDAVDYRYAAPLTVRP